MSDTPEPGALVDRRGNVMVITINRPDARNAVNGRSARPSATRCRPPRTIPTCGPSY